MKLARHADHLVGTHRDRYLGSELVSEHLRRSAADARVPRRIFRVRRRGEQRCPARIGHLLSPRDAARDRRTPVVLGDKHQCDVAACIQDALLSGGEQTSCSVVFAEHHVGSLNCGRTARGAGWPARRDVDRGVSAIDTVEGVEHRRLDERANTARAEVMAAPDTASAIAEMVRTFLIFASWSARSIRRWGAIVLGCSLGICDFLPV